MINISVHRPKKDICYNIGIGREGAGTLGQKAFFTIIREEWEGTDVVWADMIFDSISFFKKFRKKK